MAFRRMIKKPEPSVVTWPAGLSIDPWTEGKSKAIGRFLHRVEADLCDECSDGSLASAIYYAGRAIAYQKRIGSPYYDAAQAASSLVSEAATGEMIAACLVCAGEDGCGVYHIEVDAAYQRRGMATAMLRHALNVLAERHVPLLDLWRCDDSPGARIYERLGFELTGETE